jgi:hypothetical protein
MIKDKGNKGNKKESDRETSPLGSGGGAHLQIKLKLSLGYVTFLLVLEI